MHISMLSAELSEIFCVNKQHIDKIMPFTAGDDGWYTLTMNLVHHL